MKKWNIVVIDLVPKVSQDLVLASSNSACEVDPPKYSLDEVKAITHPGFGGPGRERYSLAI